MTKANKYFVEVAVLLSLVTLLVFKHKFAFMIIMLIYAISLTLELKNNYNYFIMIRHSKHSFKISNIKLIFEKSLNCSLIVALGSSVSNFFAGILMDYNSFIVWLMIFIFFFALGNMIEIYLCNIKKTLAILIVIWLFMFTINPITIFIQVLSDINYWSEMRVMICSIIGWFVCSLISCGLNYYLVKE